MLGRWPSSRVRVSLSWKGIVFRDAFSATEGLDDMLANLDAIQVFMPGMTLARAGNVHASGVVPDALTTDERRQWVVLDTFDGVKWVQQPNAVDTIASTGVDALCASPVSSPAAATDSSRTVSIAIIM